MVCLIKSLSSNWREAFWQRNGYQASATPSAILRQWQLSMAAPARLTRSGPARWAATRTGGRSSWPGHRSPSRWRRASATETAPHGGPARPERSTTDPWSRDGFSHSSNPVPDLGGVDEAIGLRKAVASLQLNFKSTPKNPTNSNLVM